MLMKSGINPFDSQEVVYSFVISSRRLFDEGLLFLAIYSQAKPYKNDPEILAMTNLVRYLSPTFLLKLHIISTYLRLLFNVPYSIFSDLFIS